MQNVQPKWLESGAVLICEKCYKLRIPDETPDVARRIGTFNLRDWLKKRLKEAGYGKRIRAISTGCLDVCAKGLVTVCIMPQHADGQTETLILDPIEEREALYAHIIRKLGDDAK
ncbi:MAG: hypothetical protein ACYDGM_01035 [Vulcanimicrobiaceae bacterium]